MRQRWTDLLRVLTYLAVAACLVSTLLASQYSHENAHLSHMVHLGFFRSHLFLRYLQKSHALSICIVLGGFAIAGCSPYSRCNVLGEIQYHRKACSFTSRVTNKYWLYREDCELHNLAYQDITIMQLITDQERDICIIDSRVLALLALSELSIKLSMSWQRILKSNIEMNPVQWTMNGLIFRTTSLDAL